MTVEIEVLRQLFSSMPPDFVAARNATVKRLRSEQLREEATTIAALRRPGWIDWALNVAAVEHTAAIEEFAAAAEALRDAQAATIEGRNGPDLRTSLRGLREATRTMAGLAAAKLRDASRTPDVAALGARLGSVASHSSTVHQLRHGVLGSADIDEVGMFDDVEPKSSSRTSRRAETNGEAEAAAVEAAAAAAQERARLEAARDLAGEEHLAARAAVAAADDELQAAERTLGAARRHVETAERAAAGARAHRDTAVRELSESETALEAARVAAGG